MLAVRLSFLSRPNIAFVEGVPPSAEILQLILLNCSTIVPNLDNRSVLALCAAESLSDSPSPYLRSTVVQRNRIEVEINEVDRPRRY